MQQSEMTETENVVTPSWMKWPPNCCQTCTGWAKDEKELWVGRCNQSPVNDGDKTDARYRCPDFKRKSGV